MKSSLVQFVCSAGGIACSRKHKAGAAAMRHGWQQWMVGIALGEGHRQGTSPAPPFIPPLLSPALWCAGHSQLASPRFLLLWRDCCSQLSFWIMGSLVSPRKSTEKQVTCLSQNLLIVFPFLMQEVFFRGLLWIICDFNELWLVKKSFFV